jgi:hypothetical protein
MGGIARHGRGGADGYEQRPAGGSRCRLPQSSGRGMARRPIRTRPRLRPRSHAARGLAVVVRALVGDLARALLVGFSLILVRHPSLSLASAKHPDRLRIAPPAVRASPFCVRIPQRTPVAVASVGNERASPYRVRADPCPRRTPPANRRVRPPRRRDPSAVPWARMIGCRMPATTAAVGRRVPAQATPSSLANARHWARRSHLRSERIGVCHHRGTQREHSGESQDEDAQFRSPAAERL